MVSIERENKKMKKSVVTHGQNGVKKMTKYQEALDNLKEPTDAWSSAQLQMAENFEEPIVYKHQEDIDTLQELVDKAKPKFVLCPKGFQGMRYTRYYCPNCKKSVRNDDECCHKCGQNIKFPKIKVTNNKAYLDWSDEDE